MRIKGKVFHSRGPAGLWKTVLVENQPFLWWRRADGREVGYIVSRQASRCYELYAQTHDVLHESFEQRDALCFQDEFSGIVWMSQDYYKFFGEAKPACQQTHT
jgi:hypothetical protein